MTEERGGLGIHLALAMLIFFWGAAYPIVKQLLDWLSPLELTLARFWIVLPPLVWLVLADRRELGALVRRHPWKVLALGFLGVPAYHLSLNLGTRLLKDDPASAGSAAMVSAILVGTVPAWTALFARLAGQERLRPMQWAGQALSMTGTVFIATRGDLAALNFHPGSLVVLGAPISWALYSVVARPLVASGRSSLPVTAFAVLLGTLMTSLAWPSGILGHMAALPALAWITLAFIGLASTLAGYLIWSVAVRRLGANRPSTYIYFIPVVSLVISALFLGERLGPATALGGGMILAGVLLIRRGA